MPKPHHIHHCKRHIHIHGCGMKRYVSIHGHIPNARELLSDAKADVSEQVSKKADEMIKAITKPRPKNIKFDF